jgi:hypothetical protein
MLELSSETTKQPRSVILFELNEVPYKILNWYCDLKPNSHIAKLGAQSRQYRTYVTESGDKSLQPVSTWSTLHRGVTPDRHKVRAFGQPLDKADAEYPPIWRILAEHGATVGVFGSLLSYRVPENLSNYAFYFPEPLANEPVTHPAYLSPFQEFNLAMSRLSGRQVSTAIDWKLVSRIIPTLPRLGLSASTCLAVVRQLVGERIKPATKGRRRSIQSLLAFDIFIKELREKKPAFSTFFTNHVASAQHRFWAALFPEDYPESNYSQEWIDRYKHEIEYAMDMANGFAGRLMQFVQHKQNYLLLVASSMGQEAFNTEPNVSYLAIDDFPRFMSGLGFSPTQYEQRSVMMPCYGVALKLEYVDQFRQKLDSIFMDGKGLTVEYYDGGYFLINFSYTNYHGPLSLQVSGQEISFESLGISVTKDEEGVYLSADHQPEGILLVFDPLNAGAASKPQENDKISVLEIAPSILRQFGVPIPSYIAPML